ncbi:MAG: hypothetical protein RR230_08230, partial [Oscillospiraceae bacterium]
WPLRFIGAVPTSVSGIISLCSDDGFELRRDNCADWLRVILTADTLTLTNDPEPPPTPTPVPDTRQQITTEDIAESILDMECRMTILEQGGKI